MTKPINESLYLATKESLLTANAPNWLAEETARIIATDDPNEADLGRTKRDREIIAQALPYVQNSD